MGIVSDVGAVDGHAGERFATDGRKLIEQVYSPECFSTSAFSGAVPVDLRIARGAHLTLVALCKCTQIVPLHICSKPPSCLCSHVQGGVFRISDHEAAR